MQAYDNIPCQPLGPRSENFQSKADGRIPHPSRSAVPKKFQTFLPQNTPVYSKPVEHTFISPPKATSTSTEQSFNHLFGLGMHSTFLADLNTPSHIMPLEREQIPLGCYNAEDGKVTYREADKEGTAQEADGNGATFEFNWLGDSSDGWETDRITRGTNADEAG